MELPNYVFYIVTWIGLVAGIASIFGEAEDTLKKEVKKDLRTWLDNIKNKTISYSANTFLEIFDSYFTKRPLSFAYIKKSAFISLASVSLLILFWGAKNSNQLFSYFLENHVVAIFGVLAAISFNLIPDYISIIQTKYFLEKLKKESTALMLITFLLVDILATFLIGIIPYVLLWHGDMGNITLEKFLKDLLILENNYGFGSLPSNEINDPPLGIYFYATFFTSFWFWLYTLSVILISIFNKLILPLDTKNKPIRSIGVVSNIIISFLFFVILVTTLTM